jgi:hypothetical protein
MSIATFPIGEPPDGALSQHSIVNQWTHLATEALFFRSHYAFIISSAWVWGSYSNVF